VQVHAATSMNASATALTSPFVDNGAQPATATAVFVLTTFDFNRNQVGANACVCSMTRLMRCVA
jgi:hypothetical protein